MPKNLPAHENPKLKKVPLLSASLNTIIFQNCHNNRAIIYQQRQSVVFWLGFIISLEVSQSEEKSLQREHTVLL